MHVCGAIPPNQVLKYSQWSPLPPVFIVSVMSAQTVVSNFAMPGPLTPPLVFGGAAVVFVIDSCHRDRLMEAHSELAKLLTEKELRDALLLIFANKQVRRGVVGCERLRRVNSPRGDSLCAGRSRRRVCGGDDGAAEPSQAVLWEELAHSGLRRP